MMERFRAKHALHMSVYGEDNHKRLTGHHETSSWKTFSYGVGNRGASFRIPTQVANQDGKGYVEDRRPASNIDPYVVGSVIYDTALDIGKAQPMIEHYEAYLNWIKTTKIELA